MKLCRPSTTWTCNVLLFLQQGARDKDLPPHWFVRENHRISNVMTHNTTHNDPCPSHKQQIKLEPIKIHRNGVWMLYFDAQRKHFCSAFGYEKGLVFGTVRVSVSVCVCVCESVSTRPFFPPFLSWCVIVCVCVCAIITYNRHTLTHCLPVAIFHPLYWDSLLGSKY